jgi:mRNA-degrading endonuclease RelE of RelBE toxin-antitoxin system
LTWSLEVSSEFEDDYRRNCGRNTGLRRAVDRKVAQIAERPLHYKPLRAPLQGVRRVHIGPFVLLFEPDERREVVRLLRLAHHDEAYGI